LEQDLEQEPVLVLALAEAGRGGEGREGVGISIPKGFAQEAIPVFMITVMVVVAAVVMKATVSAALYFMLACC
jgi:hypothetical protein